MGTAQSEHRKNATFGAISGHNSSKQKNPDGAGEVQQFIQSYAPEAYMVMRPQMGAGFNLQKDIKIPELMKVC